ncbi:hypothetical protein Tco_1523166 [Tanacetum coccineum]
MMGCELRKFNGGKQGQYSSDPDEAWSEKQSAGEEEDGEVSQEERITNGKQAVSEPSSVKRRDRKIINGSADGPTVVNDKDNKQDSVIEVKENIQEEATGCTMVVNDHDGTQEKVPGDDVIVEKKDQEDTQIAATTSQMSTSSSGSKESARNLKGRVE